METLGLYKDKIIKKIVADYFECQEDEITVITQNGCNLSIYVDDMEQTYCETFDIYHYGVLLKEYIEDYAQSLGLKGVWIDLNDLSKDEGYYFRHCNEVFEGLIEYENRSTK